MRRFDVLTKYIPRIQAASIGEWVIDTKIDGTSGHPIQMPFAAHSEMVDNFTNDIYTLEKTIKISVLYDGMTNRLRFVE